MARSKHPWRRLQRNVCIYLKYEYYGYSMDELAEHYGLSHQRISQIVRNVYYREYHGDEEYIAEIDKQSEVNHRVWSRYDLSEYLSLE